MLPVHTVLITPVDRALKYFFCLVSSLQSENRFLQISSFTLNFTGLTQPTVAEGDDQNTSPGCGMYTGAGCMVLCQSKASLRNDTEVLKQRTGASRCESG